MNKINQLQETKALKSEIYQFAGIAEQLADAAEADNFEEVKALINSGIQVSSANYLGLTALHYACKNGNLEMVNTLIAQGADLNIISFSGCIPLHQAYDNSHYSIVNRLIEHGADVNIRGNNDFTLLHSTCNHPRGLIADKSHENLNLLATLLAQGAEVNAQTDFGATPLFYAAMRGYNQAVELLINHGADINIKLNDNSGSKETMGDTAISWATFYSQKDTVKLIKQLTM